MTENFLIKEEETIENFGDKLNNIHELIQEKNKKIIQTAGNQEVESMIQNRIETEKDTLFA